MKRKHLKLALWATSVPLALVLAAAVYVSVRYTVRPTLAGDDLLVLGSKQAKECEDGGGCASFSEREFMAALAPILQRRQNWKEGS